MRYFILSEHGGIGYLAALRILGQDPHDVCTFLVPFNEAETWTSDPQLRAYIASKSALVVSGDAKNIDDVQRAWHVAEMGIDSECSGIEAVIISDVPNQLPTLKPSSSPEELLAVLKCFPSYPYPPFKMDREPFGYSAKTRALNFNPRMTPLHMPRSPSYSSRPPRLILVSPSRSLKRLHPNARGSKEEQAIAWATGKKVNSSTTAFTMASSPSTEPGTPINADSHSIHSSYSNQLTLSKSGSLFPEDPQAMSSVSGGWLDPKHALIVRPAVLMRRRCRGDENAESSVPYRIQEEFTIRDRGGGWTISKRDVAHFIVEKALDQWPTWGGRRVRIAY